MSAPSDPTPCQLGSDSPVITLLPLSSGSQYPLSNSSVQPEIPAFPDAPPTTPNSSDSTLPTERPECLNYLQEMCALAESCEADTILSESEYFEKLNRTTCLFRLVMCLPNTSDALSALYAFNITMCKQNPEYTLPEIAADLLGRVIVSHPEYRRFKLSATFESQSGINPFSNFKKLTDLLEGVTDTGIIENLSGFLNDGLLRVALNEDTLSTITKLTAGLENVVGVANRAADGMSAVSDISYKKALIIFPLATVLLYSLVRFLQDGNKKDVLVATGALLAITAISDSSLMNFVKKTSLRIWSFLFAEDEKCRAQDGALPFTLDEISGLIASLITNIALCFGGKEGKYADRILNHVGNLPKYSGGIAHSLAMSAKYVEQCVNQVYEAIGQDPTFRVFSAGDSRVDDWISSVDNLSRKQAKGEFPINNSNFETVTQLEIKGRVLRTEMLRAKENSMAVTVKGVLDTLANIKKPFARANLSGNNVRTQPSCTMFYGSSGVGKSSMLYPFLYQLLADTLPSNELDTFEANPDDYIYNRFPEQEYWDGYAGQHALTLDDFGQKKDTGESAEFMDLIRIGSQFPLNLHMAHLEQKGTTTFTSKVVVASANRLEVPMTSVTEAEAVWRRFSNIFQVVPKPEYCKEGTHTEDINTARLDVHKIKVGAFDPDIYHFYEYSCFDAHNQFREPGKNKTPNDGSGIINIPLSWDQMYEKVKNTTQRNLQSGNATDRDLRGLKATYLAARRARDLENASDLKAQSGANGGGSLESLIDFTKRCKKVFAPGPRPPVKATSCDFLGTVRLEDEDAFYDCSEIELAVYDVNDADHYNQMYAKIDAKLRRKLAVCLDYLLKKPQCAYMRHLDPYQLAGVLVQNFRPHCEHALMGESIEHDVQSLLLMFRDQPKWVELYEYGFDHAWTPDCFIRSGMVDGTRKIWERTKSFYRELCAKYPMATALFKASLVLTPIILGLSWLLTPKTAVVEEFPLISSLPTEERELLWDPQGGLYRSRRDGKLRWRTRGKLARFTSDDDGHEWFQAMSGDQNGEDIIKKIIIKSTYHMTLPRESTTVDYGMVTFVKGRIAILPNHFRVLLVADLTRGEFKPSDKLHFTQVTTRSVITVTVADFVNLINVAHPEDDVVFVEFPRQVVQHPDITSFFLQSSALNEDRDYAVRLVVARGDSNFIKISYAPDAKIVLGKKVSCEAGNYTMVRSFEYGAITSAGDCGALLTLVDPTSRGAKILGIHVAGITRSNTGLSNCLSREDIVKGISFFAQPAPVAQSGSKIAALGYEVIQVLDKPVGTPTHTKIIPSKLIGEFGPVLTRPAFLGPFTRNDEYIDPNMIAVAKYAGPLPELDPDQYAIAGQHYFSHVANNSTKNFPPRIFSNEEAVLGIPGVPFCDAMPRNTSPGYPYTLNPTPGFGGKTRFFGLGQEFDLTRPECVQLFKDCDEVIELAKKGVRSDHIFQDVLKDERRPTAKVFLGSTRLVSACSVLLSIVTRRYFLAFSVWMMQNHTANGSAIGCNPYSYDWQRIANYVREFGDHIISGDYSNHDGSLTRVMLEAILAIIEMFYTNSTEEDRRVRRILFEEVWSSKHVNGRTIYQWNGRLPSGHPLTTIINTIANQLNIRVAWMNIRGGGATSLQDFDTCVKAITYGDDNVIGVSERAHDFFNPVTLSAALRDLGMKYTNTAKTGTQVEFETLNQTSFLKRGFRFEPLVGRLVAPLEREVVTEMCYWTKRGSSALKNTRQTFDTAIGELSLHGEFVYGGAAPLMLKKARELIGHTPTYTDWHTVFRQTCDRDGQY